MTLHSLLTTTFTTAAAVPPQPQKYFQSKSSLLRHPSTQVTQKKTLLVLHMYQPVRIRSAPTSRKRTYNLNDTYTTTSTPPRAIRVSYRNPESGYCPRPVLYIVLSTIGVRTLQLIKCGCLLACLLITALPRFRTFDVVVDVIVVVRLSFDTWMDSFVKITSLAQHQDCIISQLVPCQSPK